MVCLVATPGGVVLDLVGVWRSTLSHYEAMVLYHAVEEMASVSHITVTAMVNKLLCYLSIVFLLVYWMNVLVNITCETFQVLSWNFFGQF